MQISPQTHTQTFFHMNLPTVEGIIDFNIGINGDNILLKKLFILFRSVATSKSIVTVFLKKKSFFFCLDLFQRPDQS